MCDNILVCLINDVIYESPKQINEILSSLTAAEIYCLFLYSRLDSSIGAARRRSTSAKDEKLCSQKSINSHLIHICTHLDSVRVGAVDAPDEFNDFSRINVMERASNNNILSF